MVELFKKIGGLKLLLAVLGAALYAFGINAFVVPAGLYSGGVLGIAQILRTLLGMIGVSAGFDISGIISYLINVPLFFLAFRSVGRSFFFRTTVCVTLSSIFLTLFPIPGIPIIEDPLTASLIGGVICGYAIGLIQRRNGYPGYVFCTEGKNQCGEAFAFGQRRGIRNLPVPLRYAHGDLFAALHRRQHRGDRPHPHAEYQLRGVYFHQARRHRNPADDHARNAALPTGPAMGLIRTKKHVYFIRSYRNTRWRI